MKPTTQPILLLAGLFGLAGVTLGALGAHALEETLAGREATASWNTAVLYHLVHTAALLACGMTGPGRNGRLTRWAAGFFAGGILVFSGSIYLLSLGGPRFLGPITPVGGLLFMVGWGLITAAAFRSSGKPFAS